MNTKFALVRFIVAGMLLVPGVAMSQATKAQAKLAAEMGTAKHVPLADGIVTASATGKPISARYEFEDGKLLLSVFVEKGGAFSEVFVDHMTGKVSKIDKITGGDDLKDAKVQSKASAKATATLASAVATALAANPGYIVVDVTPLAIGKVITAEITLMKDGKFKAASYPIS